MRKPACPTTKNTKTYRHACCEYYAPNLCEEPRLFMLCFILHYFFSFSTDYQYNLVRSIFTFTPEYSLIDAPHQIQMPWRLYAPLKISKKREKSPKKDAKSAKGKKKKEEPPSPLYMAFLEVRILLYLRPAVASPYCLAFRDIVATYRYRRTPCLSESSFRDNLLQANNYLFSICLG